MTNIWLPSTHRYDLSSTKGYGPFGAGMFHGVIVHVNDINGDTPPEFYENSPEVCPNFQVDRDGTKHQMLPMDWQPWCQAAGNQTYAAIECGGLGSSGYTAAQIVSVGQLLKAYHDHMGMRLQLANAPGEYGVGMHRMGGSAWGGHTCPGDIRASQRGLLIAAATPTIPVQPTTPRSDRLITGQMLFAGQRLYSIDKRYYLTVQTDGNLVLYSASGPQWATYNNDGYRLSMQGDGNLVLYTKEGHVAWSPLIQNRGGNRLVVQSDGNLVVYSATKPVWDIRNGRL